MGKGLERFEQGLAKVLHGSPHPQYRQPLWRALDTIDLSKIAMSSVFSGDISASSFSSRGWRSVAVLGVEPQAWNKLIQEHPDGVPALVYKIENNMLRVGRLASYDDLGAVGSGDAAHPGHGLSLSRHPLQFALAVATADDRLFTPPQEALVSQGTIDISMIGRVGSGYEHTYFST